MNSTGGFLPSIFIARSFYNTSIKKVVDESWWRRSPGSGDTLASNKHAKGHPRIQTNGRNQDTGQQRSGRGGRMTEDYRRPGNWYTTLVGTISDRDAGQCQQGRIVVWGNGEGWTEPRRYHPQGFTWMLVTLRVTKGGWTDGVKGVRSGTRRGAKGLKRNLGSRLRARRQQVQGRAV